MIPPGLLVAAPASGCGKTTVTLGLLAAWRAAGLAVQPFKNGPDYLDPAFHTAAAGRASFNLDSWAMGRERVAGLLGAAEGCDLLLAEASVGLFDGAVTPGEWGRGAGADLAEAFGWPVLLVLDVRGQAQSAAAVALGFASLRPGLKLAGVLLNRVGSTRHEATVRSAVEAAGFRVFGALPRDAAVALPERHLGLVQAEELPERAATLAALGRLVADHVDLNALRAAAAGACEPTPALPLPPPGARIALARDAAFSFVYPHLLDAWHAAGAALLPFSPLADEAPDDSADACWLPGGYPELHAGRLAAATRWRDGLRAFAQTRPVHGECGGYMALGSVLEDADGTRHPMAGLLGLETSFRQRRLHLGYRLAELQAPLPGYAAGTRLRGHEFHYASVSAQPDAPLARIVDADGREVAETGSWRVLDGGGRVSGSFFHLVAPAGG
ncbi:cobyrinate a,c-diamide synthase [Rubrivivax gelatinosus]|uniref:Cobyrinate a,c-diamide synthase n=1 Tax=Rubrivivax gelatinosus TaxID=28068 RepID=A0A4R2MUZ9_RUBGE|nr:cobyrinate a,c-diamide synthase [Rubrivivax gelatinosus]MBK1687835.1 cobyrinic acid a,c-diamide synthase [Rubrivivax gelatinosus]TCP03453.1 hydrogenobyrinic acid a,c-diamide synthase (glutamine-hydrolysing) /cobyrinate a,c-diamide synthase [Rubrivivax gelatinosus]